MLNRRTLRVKAMQTLFAYKQGIGSNLELAKDYIKETFSPDLNSMDYQDPILLKDGKEKGLKVFKEIMLGNGTEDDDKPSLEAAKAYDLYKKLNDKDKNHLRKLMIKDVDFVYDLYIFCLSLIPELQKVAESRKGNPYNNFVKNLLIEQLKLNNTFNDAKLESSLNWTGRGTEVREWFRTMVEVDEDFLIYNKEKTTSFEKDFEILNHLVKKVFFSCEVFNSYMEELDLRWSENKSIVRSLVQKTLKSMDSDSDSFELQALSYSWEEDKTFFIDLFDKTVKLDSKYADLIAEKANNWDIERLAITDRVIIELAITEMLYFNSIPIKVTINEYIEVSKRYSTPKSKQFINGMLDVIADYLSKSGDIKKSGRGLIDNK